MESAPPISRDKPRGRFPLIVAGAVAALAAGLGAAALMVLRDKGPKTAPPASQAGLVIDATEQDPGKIDPAKPLRCFVNGQFVGELSLTDCARRNGVATDALDVGLDASGALSAADQAGQTLTPLPPPQAVQVLPQPAPVVDAHVAAPGRVADCWSYGGGRWRKLPGDMELNACVQQIFAGRCEKPGGATYGRFGGQTLRLVTGRVEVSDDNKSFRTLVSQGGDCAIPPVG